MTEQEYLARYRIQPPGGTSAGTVQGLGDRVAKVLRVVGIDGLVKRLERRTGWRCGCERRQAALNRLGEALQKWVSTRRP